MNPVIRLGCLAALPLLATAASAQVTFYEREGFRGQAYTANGDVANMQRRGFNDQASSAIVERGQWEVCTDAQFRGDCRVLRSGSYDSLRGMGLGNRISSVRRARGRGDNDRYTYAPEPLREPNYDYRRRPRERLYEARVTSTHAVYETNNERCWSERDDSQRDRGRPNVGGAIIGGILGGVLGHQIGGGSGKDIATGVGAIGGAVVGSNVGRNRDSNDYGRRVERCTSDNRSSQPMYWDVAYNHRGTDHRAQMASPPGDTITVNNRGEPRG
jgi:uncharacterized protein YcfJ